MAPRLLASAGIPDRYLACTLANFKIDEQNRLLEARELCSRYIDNFVTENGRFAEAGLLFVGPPGVGKTHLAVSVLKELITRYRVRGRFEDFTSLIHRIQATFEPGTVDSKNAILRRATEAELLVLDELGAQKPSAWVSEILYLVINTRYSRRLPTIFTTNLRLEAPGADAPLDRERSAPPDDPLSWRVPTRLVSRLYEMARPISIDAVDFRHQVKRHQHAF
ncbi:MAG: ATP-binding protein [bacterium]|nr:ATP-binding protein [bacterium]